MRIQDILDQEGRDPLRIDSGLSVEDAVNLMVDKDSSALIVTEGDRPVGIFTERDVLCSYAKFKPKTFSEIGLKNAMTNKLIVARPEDEIDATISLMVQTSIRHLPVVEDGEITSLLNMCDLVHYQVGNLSAELHYLEEYLNDLHDAGRD
ncbi:MAG: CBS domain-containing protein [Pseudomonadota bacterium]